jgi:hypothetical protein
MIVELAAEQLFAADDGNISCVTEAAITGKAFVVIGGFRCGHRRRV